MEIMGSDLVSGSRWDAGCGCSEGRESIPAAEMRSKLEVRCRRLDFRGTRKCGSLDQSSRKICFSIYLDEKSKSMWIKR